MRGKTQLRLSAVMACVFLAGCSSVTDNLATFFANRKYEDASCEDLARQRENWSTRRQELKLLMDRAEQSPSDAVINLVAYKGEYVSASEEVKMIEIAAREKNCASAQSWDSNSAIQ
jgi:hypothetical protein